MSQPSDDANAPSTKRPRTESESPDPTMTRSDIWHDDGSVVLQVEATQFRVHWSILSLNSTVFRDMRGLPQPADQPTIEGCPVIQLHDSSVDVEYLLATLYDPLLFSVDRPPLAFIGAIVRLGRKYDFKDLLAAAVQRLTYENPTTFSEYEKLMTNGGYLPQKYRCRGSNLFDIITLAQENGLFSVLPCAYLHVIRFRPTEEILKCGNSSLIVGQRRLWEAQWEQASLWFWLSLDQCAVGCTENIFCTEKKNRAFRGLIKNQSLIPFRGSALAPSLCEPCALHHKKLMVEARKKMWDDLPGFFGLAPWAELKNDI
ncbi:hypothetical protein B0H12DRAFT_162659 [Mycena haematopus]|nr:hypothetical protein B0H12DRAFT_162659 [Mycena haematopus]